MNFINNYLKNIKLLQSEISDYINPKINLARSEGGLKFIQFKNLETWDVSYTSRSLIALADKVFYMATTNGNPISITPMLNAITKGLRKIDNRGYGMTNRTTHNEENKRYFLGHFFWNHKVHTLNENELKHLKRVIKTFGIFE